MIKRKMTRRQKVGLGIVVVAVLLSSAAGTAWFLLGQVLGPPSPDKVVATAVSPDGAYVATVVDWDEGGFGGGSVLHVKPKKPSSFIVRLSRLFAKEDDESFFEIVNIKWTQRRTLQIHYLTGPGVNESPDTSWGDVHFDNKPIRAQ